METAMKQLCLNCEQMVEMNADGSPPHVIWKQGLLIRENAGFTCASPPAFTVPLNTAGMYRFWFDNNGGIEIWTRGVSVFGVPVKKNTVFLMMIGDGAQLDQTITDPRELAVAAAGQIIGRLSDHTAAEWTAEAMARQSKESVNVEA